MSVSFGPIDSDRPESDLFEVNLERRHMVGAIFKWICILGTGLGLLILLTLIGLTLG